MTDHITPAGLFERFPAWEVQNLADPDNAYPALDPAALDPLSEPVRRLQGFCDSAAELVNGALVKGSLLPLTSEYKVLKQCAADLARWFADVSNPDQGEMRKAVADRARFWMIWLDRLAAGKVSLGLDADGSPSPSPTAGGVDWDERPSMLDLRGWR